MLAFHNGFEYHNSDLQMLKVTIFATFYANLVKIGPLTPEILQEVSAFWDDVAEIDMAEIDIGLSY